VKTGSFLAKTGYSLDSRSSRRQKPVRRMEDVRRTDRLPDRTDYRPAIGFRTVNPPASAASQSISSAEDRLR